jgi:hypothetical protein
MRVDGSSKDAQINTEITFAAYAFLVCDLAENQKRWFSPYNALYN